MRIRVERKWKKDAYTIGRLYVDGQFICNTLEDKDRNLYQGQGEKYIREHKVQDETAIPYGKYEVVLDVYSPSFGSRKYYKEFCNGYLPRLKDVEGFVGILIHRGTNADHSSGCILVGDNTVKGGLTNSRERFEQLYLMMKEAVGKGERIWLDVE